MWKFLPVSANTVCVFPSFFMCRLTTWTNANFVTPSPCEPPKKQSVACKGSMFCFCLRVILREVPLLFTVTPFCAVVLLFGKVLFCLVCTVKNVALKSFFGKVQAMFFHA